MQVNPALQVKSRTVWPRELTLLVALTSSSWKRRFGKYWSPDFLNTLDPTCPRWNLACKPSTWRSCRWSWPAQRATLPSWTSWSPCQN